MVDEETCIHRVNDYKGTCYKLTGNGLDAAWDNLLKLGLVALSLKGHERTLFKSHQSFKYAERDFEAPAVSVSKPLRSVANIELSILKKRFKVRLSSLLEGIFRLNFTNQDCNNDEHMQDKPYLQGVLLTFLPFPPVSYNEVHLEYRSPKHLVGGSYDVIVGSETNGNKPIVRIEGNDIGLHLGSITEAKSTFTRLAPSTSESSSFTKDPEDLKRLIKPMLEVMAISQVATFPNPDVPVVNFVGNKLVFRPLLYFKELDVILTTPRVIHLCSSQDSIDVLGLMVMFTFVHLHWMKIVKFQPDSIAQSFPMSGWKSALQQGKDGYHTSKLTVVGIKNKFPHVGSKSFIHRSSSSEDDEDSSGEEDRDSNDKKDRVSTKISHPDHGTSNAKRSENK